jgi:hypothetical protein
MWYLKCLLILAINSSIDVEKIRSLLVTAASSFGCYMVYGHIEAWSSFCRPFRNCLRGATLVKCSILVMNEVVIVEHCRVI